MLKKEHTERTENRENNNLSESGTFLGAEQDFHRQQA